MYHNTFILAHYNKDPHRNELTIDEGVVCLEEELVLPGRENKRLDADDGIPGTSVSTMSIFIATSARRQALHLALADFDFSGVPHVFAQSSPWPRTALSTRPSPVRSFCWTHPPSEIQ